MFFNHVPTVIGPCSQEQMINTNTGGIVATVKNTKAVWNRPLIQDPSHSMGRNRFATSGHQQNAIAKSSLAAVPQPTTFILFVDFGPESFFSCHTLISEP